jgi:hypothetical protein
MHRFEVTTLFHHRRIIVTPVETGVHPLPWIPFFNGMTKAARQLDSGPSLS